MLSQDTAIVSTVQRTLLIPTAYVDSWLVKLNNSTNDSVVELPALVVAWIWYLHKTNPVSYQHDCIRLYSRILDVPIGVNPFQHSSSLSTPTKHKRKR